MISTRSFYIFSTAALSWQILLSSTQVFLLTPVRLRLRLKMATCFIALLDWGHPAHCLALLCPCSPSNSKAHSKRKDHEYLQANAPSSKRQNRCRKNKGVEDKSDLFINQNYQEKWGHEKQQLQYIWFAIHVKIFVNIN